MKYILSIPLFIIAGIAAALLFAALKPLSLLYGKDSGYIFLRKVLGKESHQWVIVVEEQETFTRASVKE